MDTITIPLPPPLFALGGWAVMALALVGPAALIRALAGLAVWILPVVAVLVVAGVSTADLGGLVAEVQNLGLGDLTRALAMLEMVP